MKSSFGKLRKLALHRHDADEKREFQPPFLLDELAQASEDMQAMRSCYDSLLSSAAATANSAYEFSESLRDMGSCILEKTALNDDEKTGEVLLMLGKAQFELQKFVDSYRAHIVMTITNPSESLLKELRTVEEMKRQCDEKRELYEYMKVHQKDKRKRGGSGDTFTSEQLQNVHDEFDDEATLCVFRLKSLKQGQSRSLLTQVARHHAAQLNFFRKGFKSLEALEPQVRQITDEQHIDYLLDDDDDGDAEDDYDDEIDEESVEADYGHRDKQNEELSFNYRRQKQSPHSPTDFAELEPSDISFHQMEGPDNEENEIHLTSVDHRIGSHSAPIYTDKKQESTEIRQTRPSISQKLYTYVLPTPPDAKEPTPSRTSTSVPRSRPVTSGRRSNKLWHSSPLEPSKHQKELVGDAHEPERVLKEGNDNPDPLHRPPPLTDLSHPYSATLGTSDGKNYHRQASTINFTTRPKPRVSISGPISSTSNYSHGVRLPIPRSSVSPTMSPTHAIPKINELHELPRPPMGNVSRTTIFGAVGDIGHSAPLISKNSGLYMINRDIPFTSSSASPLPLPPSSVTRSFSVPSNSGRAMALQAAKLLDHSNVSDNVEGIDSPTLTPISFACMMPVPVGYGVASPPSQIRGGS